MGGQRVFPHGVGSVDRSADGRPFPAPQSEGPAALQREAFCFLVTVPTMAAAASVEAGTAACSRPGGCLSVAFVIPVECFSVLH